MNTPRPFDRELLKIIRCPETRQELEPASPALLEKLNAQIVTGRIKNRAGKIVEEKLAAGLLRADGKVIYPVREVPILLVDEAIPVES